MKAICLASAATVILLLLVTAAFRLRPGRSRVRQMTILYIACVVALAGLWWATPDDLGFLHPSLLTEPRALDLLLALFFSGSAFFGGVLQLYNLADRGFSLRILIDVLDHPGGTVSVDQVMSRYGGGQGMVWMYDKRQRGLRENGLVRGVEQCVVLTAKGAALADLFLVIRRFLRLEPP